VADRTLIVCGYGPGIADAVAARFGAEGFAVALVGRGAGKPTAAAQKLEQTGRLPLTAYGLCRSRNERTAALNTSFLSPATM
jgi:NAD(P)-dependent dehydrogenase (short-subunit alcohol dehydrogenase family)